MMWFDSMVIPHNSRNPEAAEAFINFMIRPDIALMNTEWIGGFSVANMGAFELLDAEWQENPIFWPPAEKTENSEILIYLGDFMAQYERLWTEVRASR
jgi:spermidine/putrescine transport system substrate-binding protein